MPDLVDAIFAAYRDAGIDGELVIVDDNSPDGTGALADELAPTRSACESCIAPASSGSAPP